MKTAHSSRDLHQLSVLLDGRLSGPAKAAIEQRLADNAELSALYRELEHNRFLLRSLPAKRAPRNFTLSQKYAVSRPRRWGLSSFMGLASAVTALTVMLVFFRVQLFGSMAAKTAAPANLSVPEAASSAALDESESPMIITWNDFSQVRGMGGGGGEALKVDPVGGYGGGPSAVEVPEAAPLTAGLPEEGAAAESQSAAEVPAADLGVTPDPSTLILGLPAPGTGGEVIDQAAPDTRSGFFSLPSTTLWMIGLGLVSLISAALAVITRRR